MRLEYFQLIDRIVDLDLADRRPSAPRRAFRPHSTIFEGHFPGYPLMPGVLLIETMAQTSGWLVIARHQVHAHAVLRRRQGGEAALVRDARADARRSRAKLLHDGSGFAVTKAEIRCDGKLACNAEITFRLVEFPNPEFRASMDKMAALLEFPMESAGRMADAPREAWITGIGIVSCLGEGADAHWQASRPSGKPASTPRPLRPTSCIRSRRSISTSRFRRRATSARWSRGSASAPMPPGLRSTMPA